MSCKICRSEQSLVAHHISYKNNVKIIVCRSCHSNIHNGNIKGFEPIDESKYRKISLLTETIHSLQTIKEWQTEQIYSIVDRLTEEKIKSLQEASK